ncbi:hypothetical protein E6C27_scaffold89G003790 [Cucumis melo var. makuwa]|uniref:Uncharacterized protein n=1 Tax=Cucumis melo var. makuwa TaxID=1194695 RepID=A0A5A7V8M5_CUCMM|nr:hypothetical protein E6C27_scaffold89G003790 [Cucumis melo var. makuwa]
MHTSISLVISSDAHISLVIPKDAHISLVIPKDAHISLVILKDTHNSLVIPKDAHISLVIPKDAHISLMIPKDTVPIRWHTKEKEVGGGGDWTEEERAIEGRDGRQSTGCVRQRGGSEMGRPRMAVRWRCDANDDGDRETTTVTETRAACVKLREMDEGERLSENELCSSWLDAGKVNPSERESQVYDETLVEVNPWFRQWEAGESESQSRRLNKDEIIPGLGVEWLSGVEANEQAVSFYLRFKEFIGNAYTPKRQGLQLNFKERSSAASQFYETENDE